MLRADSPLCGQVRPAPTLVPQPHLDLRVWLRAPILPGKFGVSCNNADTHSHLTSDAGAESLRRSEPRPEGSFWEGWPRTCAHRQHLPCPDTCMTYSPTCPTPHHCLPSLSFWGSTGSLSGVSLRRPKAPLITGGSTWMQWGMEDSKSIMVASHLPRQLRG